MAVTLVPACWGCYQPAGDRADNEWGLDWHRLVTTLDGGPGHARRGHGHLHCFVFAPERKLCTTHERNLLICSSGWNYMKGCAGRLTCRLTGRQNWKAVQKERQSPMVADCQSGSLVFRWTADLLCGAGLDAIKGWGRIGRLDPQSLEVGGCDQCRARGQRG
jgi:hypothetical protein